jgi:hypothetical protein
MLLARDTSRDACAPLQTLQTLCSMLLARDTSRDACAPLQTLQTLCSMMLARDACAPRQPLQPLQNSAWLQVRDDFAVVTEDGKHLNEDGEFGKVELNPKTLNPKP